MCFSADGKTSSAWISKTPAQAASPAEEILASARGGGERMVARRGAGGPMKGTGLGVEQV